MIAISNFLMLISCVKLLPYFFLFIFFQDMNLKFQDANRNFMLVMNVFLYCDVSTFKMLIGIFQIINVLLFVCVCF